MPTKVEIDEATLAAFIAGGGTVEATGDPAPAAIADEATVAAAAAPSAPVAPEVPAGDTTPLATGSAPLAYLQQQLERTQDRLALVSTPGGMGALLAILILLLWVLLPANEQGYTRLQLLYHTLLGRTSLEGAERPAAGVAAPTGVSGGGSTQWSDQPPQQTVAPSPVPSILFDFSDNGGTFV